MYIYCVVIISNNITGIYNVEKNKPAFIAEVF